MGAWRPDPGAAPAPLEAHDERRRARADGRAAPRADARRGCTTTCPRAGWRRSTPVTTPPGRRCAAVSTTASGASSWARPGYATPTWPAEYGAGLSLSPGQAKHVNDVLTHYKAPRSFNIIGIGMGGPTLLSWGTEEQKQRLLRPCATNEEIWCQLFSEPGAGSDVAGPVDACRARRRRVGRQRTEGVDDARAHRPVGDARRAHRPRPAQAQGAELLRRRHAGARRRGPSARADHGRGRVQRGLLRQTPASPTRCASAPKATAGASRSPPS